jgi:hypothetical protein
MNDDTTLCWACLDDISEEVQVDLFGIGNQDQVCWHCYERILDFARSLRRAALNDAQLPTDEERQRQEG